MRITIFLISLFFAASLFAQTSDTLSVYFEFGKHEISPKQLKRIQLIPQNVYVNDLDSVHYIGMADSVGSVKANKKLGERRAREVAKYSKRYFTTEPEIKIFSKGELQRNDPARNRRVDVIFYSRAKDMKQDTFVASYCAPLCLERADSLLHRSLIKPISYRRKEYISIETNNYTSYDKVFYSARKHRIDSITDSVAIYKLKWRRSQIKDKVYDVPGYYTKVLKVDYDEFGVFTMDTACEGCGFLRENYAKGVELTTQECWQVDRFLMENSEAKRKKGDLLMATIRVPKSLVNFEDKYYVGCNYTAPLDWRNVESEKKWQRINSGSGFQSILNKTLKNRLTRFNEGTYVYADVPSVNYCTKQVVRKMECCDISPEPSECDKCKSYFYPCNSHWTICCGTQLYRKPLLIDVGFVQVQGEHRWYAAAGVDYGFRAFRTILMEPSVVAGITDSLSPYINLKLRNTLYAIPIYGKASRNWSSTRMDHYPNDVVYFNLTFSSVFMEFQEDRFRLNHSAYGEVEYFGAVGNLANSLYLNGGIGFSPSISLEQNIYPQFQFGMRIRI